MCTMHERGPILYIQRRQVTGYHKDHKNVCRANVVILNATALIVQQVLDRDMHKDKGKIEGVSRTVMHVRTPSW